MKKSIGTKLVSIMSILLVLFVVTIGIVGVNVNSMKKTSNRLGNNYLIVEKDLGIVTTMVQSQMKRCLLMSQCQDDLELVETIGGAYADECAQIQAALDEMTPLVEEIVQDGTASATDAWEPEDLLEQFSIIQENSNTIISVMPSVYDAYVKGDVQTASGLEGESIQGQMIGIETANQSLQEMLTEAIGTTQSKMQTQETWLSVIMGILLVLFLIVFAVIIVVVHRMVNPAKEASEKLEEMIDDISNNEGDLTARLSVHSEDEIGQLILGINRFVEQLQTTVQKIHTESDRLNVSVEEINRGIRNSNESTSSVSAITEELSAGMQEVAETIAQLSEDTKGIAELAEQMNRNAQESYTFVKEIKSRAQEVKDFSVSSKENASGMIEEKRQSLEQAIERSRSVKKINDLTDEILNITSQTNLLSLNASIEAARAGEAGKGFAVVADEIRMLADSSRDTANNIQEISKLVIEAVSQLSENADEILSFVGSTVIEDYGRFVAVAEQYHKDADNMDEIIGNFQRNSEGVKEGIGTIARGMSDINATIEESSQGIARAAADASDLAVAMGNMEREADRNNEISGRLMEEVTRFKAV